MARKAGRLHPRPVRTKLSPRIFLNFASSSSISDLLAVLKAPTTVPAVREELQEGERDGYAFLAEALEHVGEDVPVIQISSERVERFPELRSRLDLGETEALIGAIERGGTLATDDFAARRIASEQDVPIIGSVGILARGIHREILPIEDANRQLRTWRQERGYYAPVDRIEDILE